ncbi:MAG TPA: Ig-like domain-containing protein [Longimicrobium sp.]|nr:Ig-like domain-containing protein [Longimicrobium sp.]
MPNRTCALFVGILLLVASCRDAGSPLVPGPEPFQRRGHKVTVLQCTLSASTISMQCAPLQPGAGGAFAAGQMITGGQSKYVTLTASNFASTPTSLEFDVTVKNLMRQPLGTQDGVTLDANGVRVWFAEDPIAQPTGTVTVDSMSGVGILVSSPQPYFQYDTVLHTNQTSNPKRWRFDFSGGATSVSFYVYVVAQVQYPDGWVEVTPASATLEPTETVDLDGTAYLARADSAGPASQTLAWSSNNTGVATVNSSTGLVTAVADGTATITATNGSQSGSATITVETGP